MPFFATFNKENELVARYESSINKDIPEEAVEISEEDFWESINNNELIYKLGENGKLVGTPREKQPAESEQEIVEKSRLMAYADPISGSDRYFMEAMALQAEGYAATSSEVKEAKTKGVETRKAIKLKFPLTTKD